MGTITSGVGLISGLDYQSIIDKLMTADSKPRELVLTRISSLDAQKTAYLDVSARISALLSRIQTLTHASTFQATSVSSSAPDVLSATTTSTAQTGTYQFTVRALASTHQLVSRGFQSTSTTAPSGVLTIESAQARVNRDTRLDELNGHAGVQRGNFKITNAAGQSATINITDVRTVNEVLDKINAAGLNVTASVGENGLVLTDHSGGTGNLRVQEVDGGQTAASLGFGAGYMYDTDGDGVLAGSAVMYLANSTTLSALNDGLGVRRSLAGGDFTMQVAGSTVSVDLSETLKPDTRLERLNHGQGVRLGRVRLTSKDGSQTEVDLSSARTIGDVQTALQAAFGGSRISVSLNSSRLVVSDGTTVPAGQTAHDFVIEDVTGYSAQDLGINGTTSKTSISGRDILHVDTMADVIKAINYASGNEDAEHNPLVTAAIDGSGQRLTLRNVSAAGGSLVLTAPAAGVSHALTDLGLAAGTYEDTGSGAVATGNRIIGGLNTVLLRTLNGGTGFQTGTIRIAANGHTTDVDLSSAQTLSDVVGLINAAATSASLGVEANYDSTGTRLVLSNLDGGTATISVSDVSGTFAAATGLAQSAAGPVRSNNLQRQYISESTRLADLSNGRGVSYGSFKITNSASISKTITLNSSATTLQDVITAINDAAIGVQASINSTGDGLLLVDTAGGSGTLKVEDTGGTTAHSLNIAGTATNGRIDGSFEYKLQLGGNETIQSLATRIGNDTTLAQAALLNDGTSVAPYRLSLVSRASGQAGELIIDDSGAGFGFSTLTRAQDARILFGSAGDQGILLSSSSNTFTDAVPGLTVNAISTSTTPTTVTVGQNLDSLMATLKGLASAYNDAVDKIKEDTAYDSTTEKRGVLMGESVISTIKNRLSKAFTQIVRNSGSSINNLNQLGLKLSSSTGLTFDEDKFRAAFAADPEAVTKFFTDETNGVATTIQTELKKIADSDGLIGKRTDTLAEQRKLLQDRADALQDLLDRKRERLTEQFQAMESALASLQSQSTTISNWSDSVKSLLSSSSS